MTLAEGPRSLWITQWFMWKPVGDGKFLTIRMSMPRLWVRHSSNCVIFSFNLTNYDVTFFITSCGHLWYCASSCTYLHTNHILQVCAWQNSPWGQAALLEKSSFCLSFNVTQKLPPPALSATWWLIFVSLCLHFFYVHHNKEGCRHFSNFRYWYFCLIRRVPLGLLYLEADG